VYIIDGNNVIGQRPGWHRDREGARRRLISELARLAALRRLQLSVVFDGKPDPLFPEASRHGGVSIHYARRGATADDRIIELVEAARDRRHLIIITSDRALTSRVRLCGAQVRRSGEFRRALDETLSPPPTDQPPEVAPDDLPAWMRYFGVDQDDD
jgi:predicted RNA-binding protein with PIN domain